LTFFHAPFTGEDEAASRLSAFEIILAMRERTPFPESLIARLPALRLFNLTGRRAIRNPWPRTRRSWPRRTRC
jgi:D-3-phosphoglycerate dehydrogenase